MGQVSRISRTLLLACEHMSRGDDEAWRTPNLVLDWWSNLSVRILLTFETEKGLRGSGSILRTSGVRLLAAGHALTLFGLLQGENIVSWRMAPRSFFPPTAKLRLGFLFA